MKDECTIELELDLRVYRLLAIQKAAYRLAERFTVELGLLTDQQVEVTLRFRSGTSSTVTAECKRLFLQEMLDQELREKVGEETAPIRALILAHAFSKVDVIKRD